jgi:protease-4
MKRACLVLVLPVLIIIAGVGPGSADERPYLTPYASQVGFLPGSPGVAGVAMGGWVNPAAYRMLAGGEAQFFWSEPEPDWGVPQSWSFIFGEGALGFGVTHSKWEREALVYALGHGYAGAIPTEGTMTDYTLALSTGDKRSTSGIALHWSSGDTWERRNDQAISFGSIWRPAKQISIGAAAAFTFDEGDQRYVLDAGLRPFGSPLLTLFGDLAYMNDQDIEDAPWSAGIASELLPGVTVFGRTRDDDSYAWGVSVSLGVLGVSASPDYDKDGDLVRTTYGIRTGYRRPSLGDRMVDRGKAYYTLDLKGRTKYRRYRWFDDEGHTLSELLHELEQVRTNNRYGGVVLNLAAMQMSWAVRWEVREKLKEIQTAGKKVVVYFDYVDLGMYHLASVADHIVIDPEGGMALIGIGLARTYMKQMLTKMGLSTEEWRFFKYKSAAEGMTRDEMSEADREQRQALIDGFYDEIRDDVCNSRGFTHKFFDDLINEEVIIQADDALELGLAHEQGRWADKNDLIRKFEGEGKRFVGRTQMELAKVRKDTWGRPPQVAVIYALGPCAMDTGIAARRLGGVIRRARENPNIKAVVFRADSPGGEIVASDIVAEELKLTGKKKPVIVSQGFVAGSGGYWISMYGDRILATPLTITGSIGVIGMWIWNDGLGEKLGLRSDKVLRGDHSDILLGIRLPLLGVMVPDRNLTRKEFGIMKEQILLSYEHFLEKVADGRGMTRDEVHKVGEGRVWTGRDGLRVGLIDEIGGLEDAIAIARREAGIDEDEDVDLVELPRMGLLNPNLFRIPNPFDFGADSPEADFLKTMIENNGRPMALMPPDVITGE